MRLGYASVRLDVPSPIKYNIFHLISMAQDDVNMIADDGVAL